MMTMQGLLIRNKHLKWYDILEKIEDGRNSSYHSVIGASPNHVFENNQDIIDKNTNNAKDKWDAYDAIASIGLL